MAKTLQLRYKVQPVIKVRDSPSPDSVLNHAPLDLDKFDLSSYP